MIKKGFEVVKIIFIISLIVSIILFCAYSDTHYSRTGFIKSTNISNLYTFTDSNGHVWEFTDNNIIIPSNTAIKASVKMFTNNTTEYITDDIILEMKIDSLSKNKK